MNTSPDGDRARVLVSGLQTQGRFAVLVVRERHGFPFPKHVHSREDELVCVVSGHVTFDLEGERLDGPTGTWLFLPRGKEHTCSVETAEARLLIILSPAGLECCVNELSQTDGPARDQQKIEWLVTTMARYGLTITGPAQPVVSDSFEPAANTSITDRCHSQALISLNSLE
jgi:quercetin dioxygenase-like cupin family protein